MLDKILISRCFLGERVRYDGEHQKLKDSHIKKWFQQGRLIAVCPEVAGGLPIPRAPAEIQVTTGQVININGQNVTKAFESGAQQALKLCMRYNIRYALLKESSPSCGSSTIYDGSFTGNKIHGQGVTAKLLLENNVQVFSERNISELIKLVES